MTAASRRAAAAGLALVAHLLCVHVVLFRLWYASGLRKMFARNENIHFKDLQLAMKIAKRNGTSSCRAASAAAGEDREPGPVQRSRHVAILFMLRHRLEHLEAWRGWLLEDPALSEERVSLYFHLADGAETTQDALALRTLPGARRIVPSVATGWCELMAAEVALFQAALADDHLADFFVLLPHDAVPIVPLGTVLANLFVADPGLDTRPLTRICLAGVRGMEVPSSCAHAIEPHWSRSLLLKHHQWMALSRKHAERMADEQAWRLAVSFFQEWFLGEPLCSDEVLPLLLFALPYDFLCPSVGPNGVHGTVDRLPSLSDLPLFSSAAHSLTNFEASLQSIGVVSECITYVPWPGCNSKQIIDDKRAKSPIVGGGLTLADRERLMAELADSGVLFWRKLGLGGDGAAAHLALVQRNSPAKHHTTGPAPPRLMPESRVGWGMDDFFVRMRWEYASIEARLSLRVQVSLGIVAALLTGWFLTHGGAISRGVFQKLLTIYIAGHCVLFFISVAAFSEYSLLEPFRATGRPARLEV